MRIRRKVGQLLENRIGREIGQPDDLEPGSILTKCLLGYPLKGPVAFGSAADDGQSPGFRLHLEGYFQCTCHIDPGGHAGKVFRSFKGKHLVFQSCAENCRRPRKDSIAVV